MPEDFDPTKYLTKLQGKDYLEVKWRLVWFRQRHPDAHIATEILEHNAAEKWAIIKATVEIQNGGSATGMVIQAPTAIAKDYIANGETSAIGRALAALGFGTQHALELDQGDQVVDSPVPPRPPALPASTPTPPPPTEAVDGAKPTAETLARFWPATAKLGWGEADVNEASAHIYGVTAQHLTAAQLRECFGLLAAGTIQRGADGRYAVAQPPATVGATT